MGSSLSRSAAGGQTRDAPVHDRPGRRSLDFDRHRGALVLTPGVWPGGPESWEWDGRSWSLVSPTGPGVRNDFAATHDPVRGRTLMHGGGSRGISGQTWTWDGRDRTELNLPEPVPRSAHALAADPARRSVILFGGGAVQIDCGGPNTVHELVMTCYADCNDDGAPDFFDFLCFQNEFLAGCP